MNTLLQDLRYGLRMLAKNLGFTSVAVITLALGIGANTAIFSFVDGVLLKPAPYPHAERIVQLWEKPPGGTRNVISTLNYLDWQKQSTSFQYMSTIGGNIATLTGPGEPQIVNAQYVSASYFNLMGVGPMLGRGFAPDEDNEGKEHVVVLSNKIWRGRFGADPRIVGRRITLEGTSYTVIGVLPVGSVYDRTWAEIWMPLAFKPANMTRDFHWLSALARLKPGVSFEQAKAEMDSIGARIAAQYPNSNAGWGVVTEHYTVVDQPLRRALWVLLAAVFAVLIIACVNVANLSLARAAERDREVAIRSALGALRLRLVRQVLTENMLLGVVGGLVGLALGYALMRGLSYWMPPYMLPPEAEVRMDYRVLCLTFLVALLTGILFGLAPALDATRLDPAGALKEGVRTTAGFGRHRVRAALIVSEVALSFVLLTGAGLLIRSFIRLVNVDLGVDTTNVITMGLPMSWERNGDPRRLVNYLQQLTQNVQAVPSVRGVAVTSAWPMGGMRFGMWFQIAGHAFVNPSNRPNCFFKIVSPSFFSALGMGLKKGRYLAETDSEGAPPATVINETMAKRYFRGEDPIGKRVLIQRIVTGKTELGPEIPWEVVGIVADEKLSGLDDDTSPSVYVTYYQSPVAGMSLLVRGAGDPRLLVKAIEHAVWQVNKTQALTNIKTLEEIKSDSVAPNRLRTILLAIFAAIALLLAVVGIYGVISYSVTQRTHEMAIRSALGAHAMNLLSLVVGSAMLTAATGLLLGAFGSLALTRLLSSLLFETSPSDPATLLTVAGVLAAVSLFACYIPARRAARVDPMVALRYE